MILALVFVLSALQESAPKTIDPKVKAEVDGWIGMFKSNSIQDRDAARARILDGDRTVYDYLKTLLPANSDPEVSSSIEAVLRGMRKKLKIWEIDAGAKAKEHLEKNPRATIGDSTPRAMKLEGETKREALAAILPGHRFFKFNWPVFSGRPDPSMYVVVSIEGETRELRLPSDMGVDEATLKFFREEAALKPKTEGEARTFADGYAALLGLDTSKAAVTAKDGGFEVSVRGLKMTFDKNGALGDVTYRRTR